MGVGMWGRGRAGGWRVASKCVDADTRRHNERVVRVEMALSLQTDSKAPHVSTLAQVSTTRQHLRRRVVRGPARDRKHFVSIRQDGAKAKIDHLDLSI